MFENSVAPRDRALSSRGRHAAPARVLDLDHSSGGTLRADHRVHRLERLRHHLGWESRRSPRSKLTRAPDAFRRDDHENRVKTVTAICFGNFNNGARDAGRAIVRETACVRERRRERWRGETAMCV